MPNNKFLSDSTGIRTYNHFGRKRALYHLANCFILGYKSTNIHNLYILTFKNGAGLDIDLSDIKQD